MTFFHPRFIHIFENTVSVQKNHQLSETGKGCQIILDKFAKTSNAKRISGAIKTRSLGPIHHNAPILSETLLTYAQKDCLKARILQAGAGFSVQISATCAVQT